MSNQQLADLGQTIVRVTTELEQEKSNSILLQMRFVLLFYGVGCFSSTRARDAARTVASMGGINTDFALAPNGVIYVGFDESAPRAVDLQKFEAICLELAAQAGKEVAP